MVGVGDNGGQPVQVVENVGGQFADMQHVVSIEEAQHPAVDFFGREGLADILQGKRTQGSQFIRVEYRQNDGFRLEGRPALRRGVEAVRIRQVDGVLQQTRSRLGQFFLAFIDQGDQRARQRCQAFFETAIGAAQLVADLAQGGAQVLGMALVDILQQRIEGLQLVDDELQSGANLAFGLGRGQAAVGRHFLSRAAQPAFVKLPGLHLVDDIAAVAGNMIGGL